MRQDAPERAGNPIAPVSAVRASAYTIPTDTPESDGTMQWDQTTLVLVEAEAGGETGLGYTYASATAASLIESTLAEVVMGRDTFDVPGTYGALVHRVRNIGRPGIASMAISAVDVALWDLKARLLGVPLFKLLGAARDAVPIYGSGGFTSYSVDRLTSQLAGWVAQGIPRVKMKVGRDPGVDVARVCAAREAIGQEAALFVDANGAYTRSEALRFAKEFAGLGVTWFEEPVPQQDHEGLRLLRDRAPAGMDIAAGEYGWEARDFRQLLTSGAVSVLQADATRCGGLTGFLQADALCNAFGVPLSAHCGPSIHAHAGAAARQLVHLEYFYDHARIERCLFEGVLEPDGGTLRPDPSRPGLGLTFKRQDATAFAV